MSGLTYLRRPAVLVATGIGLSRLSGFIRNVLLVAAIGGTSGTAAGQIFDVANTLPTNFYTLIAGGVLSTVLLPSLMAMMSGGQEGRRQIDSVVTITLAIGLGGTLLLMLASPLLVRLYSSSWSLEWLRLGTWLALWCLPQVFFLVAFSLLSQLLNAYGSVVPAAWSPILANLVPIFGLLVFLRFVPRSLLDPVLWTPGMVLLVAGGASLGAVAQAVVLVVPLVASGYRFHPRLSLKGLVGIGQGAIWAIAATVVGQVAFVVTSRVSTSAGARLTAQGAIGPSLNTLNTAYLLVLVPFSLLVASYATTQARPVATAALDNDLEGVSRQLLMMGRFCLATIGPCAVLLVSLGTPLGRLFWRSETIGQVVTLLSLSLLPFSLLFVCTRVLYGLGEPKLAFVPQAAVAVLTACSAFIAGHLAPDRLVVDGIAVGISAANAIGVVIALTLLRRGLAHSDKGAVRSLLRDFGVTGSALIVATVVVAIAQTLGWCVGPVAGWAVAPALGISSYLLVDMALAGSSWNAMKRLLDILHG